jgi:hypothetical protein
MLMPGMRWPTILSMLMPPDIYKGAMSVDKASLKLGPGVRPPG